MKDLIAIVGIIFGFVALAAVFSLIPALVVMLSVNWLAPAFHSSFHLAFWQSWVGLFALGIIGRTVFGSHSSSEKS